MEKGMPDSLFSRYESKGSLILPVGRVRFPRKRFCRHDLVHRQVHPETPPLVASWPVIWCQRSSNVERGVRERWEFLFQANIGGALPAGPASSDFKAN